jgi:hypothetical protein
MLRAKLSGTMTDYARQSLQQNGYTLTHTDPIYEIKLTVLLHCKGRPHGPYVSSSKLYVDESFMPFDC